MANRDTQEWAFTLQEAVLFRDAYTLDFGNVAYKALIRRYISDAESYHKRLPEQLRTVESQAKVIFPDMLVDNLLEELDGPLYDNPERFERGEELMLLVNCCKEVLISNKS